MRFSRLHDLARALGAPAHGGPSPAAAGDPLMAHYRVADRFRAFLAARGRAAWDVTCFDNFSGLDYGLVKEFFEKRRPGHRVIGFDAESGAEAAVLYDYRDKEKDVVPQNAVYLAGDASVLAYSFLDESGWQRMYYMLAAADAARLVATLRELAEFRAELQRASDELLVVGQLRIPLDRSLGWGDVVLPEGLVGEVRASVEMFFRSRELYRRAGLAWKRGFLFVGPPGNGKTMLCKVIAGQAGVPCLYLMFGSRSQKQHPITEMFEQGRRLAPCVLVFEDLDALLGQPGEMASFLNHLDGFAARDGLLVLATTNHPEDVDEAILNRPSRFDRVWTIGAPDVGCRRAYLSRLFSAHLPPDEIAEVARATDGFSVAYLKELFLSAAQDAIQRGETREDGLPRVTLADVRVAAGRLRDQSGKAERRFVERVPMGFGREDEE